MRYSAFVLLIAAQLVRLSDAMGSKLPAWADPALPVAEGLVTWLDASAQRAAWQAHGGGPRRSNDPVDCWFDSSGNGRHVRQPDGESQPVIRFDGRLAAVRFNGRGAYLAINGLGLAFDRMTLVVVTAPFSNEGSFRGVLSMHADGEFDFVSGLNIDQGAVGSTRFDTLNVEGAGAGGMHNLRTKRDPFLQFRRLVVTSAPGRDGVELFVDGEPEGTRARDHSVIRMDELIVGGRYYGGGDAPRGFFEGEIAEMLVYDRVLSASERVAVDQYLATKYAAAGPVPPPAPKSGSTSLPPVANPPLAQLHAPGFSVRELPIKLPNVNNVLYRNDGVLVALAYDGNIHLLTDSNADGLEDRSTLFWRNEGQLRAPIGMALTPPGYGRGRGVVVAAKSQCLMLLDTDGDDRADKEVIVADGWLELQHGVDALGVTFDPHDQSIYFGLGVEDFTDAYLLGNGQNSKFRLDGERGTILRVSADLKSREVIATGIRFPVALRFNSAGDLFCTDQEGATWLANGNPFDELLHVQRARHYGFPPRHPRHLPDVVDEPSTYDYRPAHQSSCGFNFNEPGADGSVFGPSWWRSDALVTGYSRGKLYRTKLARTAAGYVAQNHLVATLGMLAVDACVAPNRSLVIAAHSGPPDWGTGPSGVGKLFKVTYSEAGEPIPALAWADGPREVRIAFDRPLDPSALQQLATRAAIEGGEFVAAADRFEALRPSYALVEHQQNAPRSRVEVQGIQLTADRRTLIVTTSPHEKAATYAVALPGIVKNAAASANAAMPQLPDIDLQYDLCGVAASWQSSATDESWAGWLPHLDLDVSRVFTQASAAHDDLWRLLPAPGMLTLGTSLNLRDMLRPAVQPGAKIDYEWPPEKVTLKLISNCQFEATIDGQAQTASREANQEWTIEHEAKLSDETDHPLVVRLRHGGKSASTPSLTIQFYTNEDSRLRALPLARFLLPWTKRSSDAPTIVDNRDRPELKGGNWLRGRHEFFGAVASCSKCHKVRGEGASIGPDLSNLTKRDYASVVRDITHPSFAINPDYVTQLILTSDGRALSGTVRTEPERLIVSDQEAKETIIPRDDVLEVQTSNLSIMPEAIPQALGPERFRDLLTFLLVEPPAMPVYGDLPPPAPRALEDVLAVLKGAEGDVTKRPLGIVLVAGPKDHGPGEHDYPAWQNAWKSLLELDEQVEVRVAAPWPTDGDLKSADVLAFYQQGTWTPERARDIDRFLRRGGGLVFIHFAVDGGGDPEGFAQRIGLAWQGGASKFRHGPIDVEFVPGGKHPIARNLDQVHFYDESYWNLIGARSSINLLATGVEDGQPQPLFWTMEPERGGRVFVSIPGHFAWTFDDPVFRILLLRGIAWAAAQPVDRLNNLVLPGSRVQAARQ